VFPEELQGKAFMTKSMASLTNDSNRSFIVKGSSNNMTVLFSTKETVQYTDSKEIKTMVHSILCRFLSAFLKIY
jgi:hypothetical protein